MNRSLLGRVAITILLIFPGTATALEAGTGQDPIHPPESGQIQKPANPFVPPEERVAARNDKDWAKADELRDAIAELGYSVQDTPQGPVLIPKKNE